MVNSRMVNSEHAQRGTVNLVTGPARSGKSEWAERLALASTKAVIYVATARRNAADTEWQQRIDQHVERRPSAWQTQEVPLALATTIDGFTSQQCVLIDSLGTWLANWLDQDDGDWQRTEAALLAAIARSAADLIFVAEETGWGVVPAYPIGRTFRDRLGRLTRQVAMQADHTYLATAGYVLDLSQLGQPIAPNF
jgi:adenosylcobinamide kinase / adenosylcobinamide-phosphate guanylyltransferase